MIATLFLNFTIPVFEIVFILLSASFLISLGLSLYSLYIRHNKAAKLFGILMLVLAMWILHKFIILFISDVKTREILHLINFFFLSVLASLFFLVTIYHTKQLEWFKEKYIPYIFIMPLIICLLVFIPPYHHLLFYDYKIYFEQSIPVHTLKIGYAYAIYIFLSTFLFIVSFSLLIKAMLKRESYFKFQMFLFFIGLFIPYVFDIFYLLGFSPIKNYNLAPVVIAFSSIFMAWSLFGYRFFKLIPVARNEVIDKIKDSMIVINSDNLIIDINKSCEALFHLDKNKIIGKSFYDIFKLHPDIIESFQQEKNIIKEICLQKEDGLRYYSASISPVNSSEHKLYATIILLHDITEEKKSRDVIKRHNQALRELNAAKNKFFSIIGHDLRNPFNIILGNAKLLNKSHAELGKDKIERISKELYEASNNTYNLLENLLEWARTQSDNISFNPEKIKLSVLFEDCVGELNHFAYNKEIAVNYSLPEEIYIYADKNMIDTIIRNLLTNAIKYTNSKGQVNLSATINNNMAEITVSDTGLGIPQTILNKLFNISESTTTSGTLGERGTGFGLLLCKEFIEKHGGKIRIESEEGTGSDFMFSIPLFIESMNNKVLDKETEFSIEILNIESGKLPLEKEIQNPVESSVEYSSEFLNTILPLKKILAEYQFYETSEILNTLKNFKCERSEYGHWRNQIENAVLHSNKNKYIDLIYWKRE